MSLLMSERDDRAHWPATDLGRAWRAPRRTGADFVDTMPTSPAPLQAAHGCYDESEAERAGYSKPDTDFGALAAVATIETAGGLWQWIVDHPGRVALGLVAALALIAMVTR